MLLVVMLYQSDNFLLNRSLRVSLSYPVDNGNTKLAVSHMQITCIYYSECTYTLLLSGIKNIVKRRKYPDTIWFLYINLSIYSSSIFVVFIFLSTVNEAVKMHLQSKKKHQKKKTQKTTTLF